MSEKVSVGLQIKVSFQTRLKNMIGPILSILSTKVF